MNPTGARASRIVLLALAAGFFFTTQAVFMALAGGRFVGLDFVVQESVYWLVWASLAPIVLALVRRWPLDRRPGAPALAAHGTISILLSVAQTVLAFGLHLAVLVAVGQVASADVPGWIRSRETSYVWGTFMGVLFYWSAVLVLAGARLRELYVAERTGAALLAARGATLEAELTRSQLDSLRSQLHPHFLFNTMNAISTLTEDDPAKARRMLLSLAALLRRSLDVSQHEVPLAQELEFLSEYLDIQRVRFGDRLTVTVEVDPTAQSALVPVLLLQPLVENAIEHGAHDKNGAGAIAIRASRGVDSVVITVEDDGPGVPTQAHREGIGLGNTRERLRRLYGDKARLELSSASRPESRGTRVAITIPVGAS